MIGDIPNIKSTLTCLADLCMPRVCVCCGRRLLSREHYLCLYCDVDLPLTYNWSLLHNPMASRFNELIQRQGEYVPFVYAASLFYYHPATIYSSITQSLKYDGVIGCGRYFATRLGSYLKDSQQFHDVDTVVPVPLHWQRQRRRGYNQAEIIAAEVSKLIGARLLLKLLYRRRNTLTQTELTIEEKTKNVDKAFAVSRRIASKQPLSSLKHILIVDDVFTTGSTLYECYKELRALLPTNIRISIATLGYVQE